MSHYLKIILDAIFGRKKFRNEIVWCYRGGGVPKNDFARKHDIILRYSKSVSLCFNVDLIRIPYSEDSVDRLRYTARAFRDARVYDNYKPNPKGKHPEDWWDIQPIMPSSKERIGYPTQKPLKFRLPDIEQNELIPSGLEFWNFVDHAQVGFGKDRIGFVEFVNEHFERAVAAIAAETEQA